MKNQKNMRRFRLRRVFRFLVFGALFIAVTGLVVMSLWNALLPEILGVSTISFAQAIGLMVLSRLLFGGFGWSNPRRPGMARSEWKEKMTERWQNLTPEQREQLKANWRNRCGNGRRGFGPRPEETTEPTSPIEKA